MPRRMRIRTSVGKFEAEFTDENPKTADAIWNSLPLKGSANTWGDEIYFAVPVEIKLENGRAEVELGSVAYWPPGSAVCIFFGPTPASKHGEPRAASPVNVFATIKGDLEAFKKVQDNDSVTLERA